MSDYRPAPHHEPAQDQMIEQLQDSNTHLTGRASSRHRRDPCTTATQHGGASCWWQLTPVSSSHLLDRNPRYPCSQIDAYMLSWRAQQAAC